MLDMLEPLLLIQSLLTTETDETELLTPCCQLLRSVPPIGNALEYPRLECEQGKRVTLTRKVLLL